MKTTALCLAALSLLFLAMEFAYLRYDEVATARGLYDWSMVERLMSDAAARGHQLILRLHDTDPRLAFLEVGFGLWAEYHVYDPDEKVGVNFPDKSFQAEFMRHMTKEVKVTRWLISKDAHVAERTPFKAMPDLLAPPFGIFDDTFHRAWKPGYNRTGWDTRPRNERPPFWMKNEIKAETDPTPPAQQKPLIDGVTATPDELAAHVCEAVQWARTHRDLNPANAVIIYAWNEHDEGGWLQPTRGADGKADDSRIHALGKALRALQPLRNAKP